MTRKEFRFQRALGTINFGISTPLRLRVTIPEVDLDNTVMKHCEIIHIIDEGNNEMTFTILTNFSNQSGTFTLGIKNADQILNMIEDQLTDEQ